MTDGKTLNVLTICGSLRKGSHNAALLRALPALAPAGMSFTPAPAYDGMPHYNWDIQNEKGFPADVTAWADAIRGADAILLAVPEFNWTIPGPLKNAIDWVSRLKEQPFKGKPISIMSAATGLLGGARMQQHLRSVLTALDGHVFGRPEVIVAFAQQKFDDKGELKDDATKEMIRAHLKAFAAYAAHVGK